MPISHVMGRVILYSTLGAGGTAYFAAKSDLSTLLDDLALVRPTKLDLVPRIWEMLFQEVQSEVDRRTTDGADRDTVETQVMAEQREKLLGGRQFSAMTGSAPISPELRAWTEEFIDIPLTEVYGSTEDGIVLVDGQVRRPPVIDYKLVDVPDLGYFATDRPHPRGELWVKSTDLIPGYYKRPEVTAELFDADGWYHTGDVVAEIATRPAGLRGPPQQRAEALAGRVRHGLQAGGGLRRPPVDPSDLRVRQQRPLLRAGGDRPDRRRTGQRRRGRRRGQAAAERRAAEHRARGRAAVLRDSARLHRRDNAFHTRERSAHRYPQAGPPPAQAVLRPRARAALHRPGRRPGRRAARRCGRTVPTVPFWKRSAVPRVRCSVPLRPMWPPMRRSPISAETRCRR